MGIAALITWLLTAVGGFEHAERLDREGRDPPAERRCSPPALIFGHLGLAVVGLVLWIIYLLTDTDALAWVAFIVLLPVAARVHHAGALDPQLPGPYGRHGHRTGRHCWVSEPSRCLLIGAFPVLSVVAGHGLVRRRHRRAVLVPTALAVSAAAEMPGRCGPAP